MSSDKQLQKAGDGATQLQANTVNIYNGVSEESVRRIVEEQYRLARQEYTADAYRIANERVKCFEESMMSRIMQVENVLPSFADPAFQLLLRHALQTAAGTERPSDYDLLTELLVCHVQKGENRKNRAGINRAIEIVGEIDNDALCALTVAHALTFFVPLSGNCTEGLNVLNILFGELMYQDLPRENDWLDHLDVLGAIRINAFGRLKKTEEYYNSAFDGYVCTGVKAESEEYYSAIKLLQSVGIGESFLIPNELLAGYYRIGIRSEKALDELVLTHGEVSTRLSEEQKEVIKQILNLYNNSNELKRQAESAFVEKWDTFDNLRKLRDWWNSIPQAFSITHVGRVLAQTNAKRCDPALPDML